MGTIIKLPTKAVKNKVLSGTAAKQEAIAELKAFWVQYPTAKKVFWEIVRVWMTAASRRTGSNGYWAAYTYPEWSKKTKLPSSTFRWNIDLLQKRGLIERKRGRHSGTRVITFMRPTNEAIDLSGGKDRFWHHLNKQHYEPELEPSNALFKPVPKTPKPAPEPSEEAPQPQTLDEVLAILNG